MFDNISHIIDLPLSKSEANRYLMLRYYAAQLLPSFDAADDVNLLRQLLEEIIDNDGKEVKVIDCDNAGTVLRFLATALSMRKGSFVLTGSERMRKRPIAELVEALNKLGASICYLENEGYPPLMIEGRDIKGGEVTISAERSSQFVSSLLLAAPSMRDGLSLQLVGDIASQPYIDMTIKMMRDCGIVIDDKDNVIKIKHQHYNCDFVKVESDWSSAAFWYELVALYDDDINVLLKNLNIESRQADAVAMNMFATLGVSTQQVKEGVIIRKSIANSQQLIFNFSQCPDLFPAVIATCAGLHVDATFTGVKNLSLKESDRKLAMMTELMKMNVVFEIVSDDILKMKCHDNMPYHTEDNPIIFSSYNDHRIVMALAMLYPKIGTIRIEDKNVVSKSYPDFWADLECFLNLSKGRKNLSQTT
ncbi:MAG: 3-phosphoshikimate 1-carboxyvinyltransferase [Bacteroidales bacterium]|nr:3-phosphoshikimate 1-carboxyvinyltransferase [Bacteroidales bacterium]